MAIPAKMMNTCNNKLLTLFIKGGGGFLLFAYLFWRQGKDCLLDTSCLPRLEAGKGLFIRYKLPTSFGGRERIVY